MDARATRPKDVTYNGIVLVLYQTNYLGGHGSLLMEIDKRRGHLRVVHLIDADGRVPFRNTLSQTGHWFLPLLRR